MASQVALHHQLKNPFVILDFKKNPLVSTQSSSLPEIFEAGKVIVFDNLDFCNLDYFFAQPGKWYPDWIPPIFGHRLQRPINESHALRALYDNDEDIREFQTASSSFEQAWKQSAKSLFPSYEWELFEFSYRFNHMDLGNLHLDVPDKAYEGHQFRWFINLDQRPRILAVGPTIFQLAEMFWTEKKIHQWTHLPVHEFVGKLRELVLDQTIFKERELPRHYLTLDPGSLWLAHSSYISHGLVYGRKTACLEAHVAPHSLKNPNRNFNTMIRHLQKYGPSDFRDLEGEV